MTKPTSKTLWTDETPENRQEPDINRKNIGFIAERLPYQHFNWLFWIIGQWLTYLETITDYLKDITDYLKSKLTNDGTNYLILQADQNGQGIKLKSKNDSGTLIDNFIADKNGNVGFSGVGYGIFNFFADSGTANAYVLSKITDASVELKKIVNGTTAWFITTNANTGASTVNVAGTGTIAIKYLDGSDLLAGAIQANTAIQLRYNSNVWLLCNEPDYCSANLIANGNFENVVNWSRESGIEIYPDIVEPIFGNFHGRMTNDGTSGGGNAGIFQTINLKTTLPANKPIRWGFYVKRYVTSGTNTVTGKIQFLNSSGTEISSASHIFGYGAATSWTPASWTDLAPSGTQIIKIYIQTHYGEDIYISSVFATFGRKDLFGVQPQNIPIFIDKDGNYDFNNASGATRAVLTTSGALNAFSFGRYLGYCSGGSTFDFYIGRYMSGFIVLIQDWGGACGVLTKIYHVTGQSLGSYVSLVNSLGSGGGSCDLTYLGYTDWYLSVVRYAQKFRVSGTYGVAIFWVPFAGGGDDQTIMPL